MHIPNHTLKLLLPNVARDSALDLASSQRHRQSFGHVVLYSCRYGCVLIRRTDPYVCGSEMLKLA